MEPVLGAWPINSSQGGPYAQQTYVNQVISSVYVYIFTYVTLDGDNLGELKFELADP